MAYQNWGTKKAGSFVAARFSEKSLGIVLLFAAIGIPLVSGYTFFVYKTLAGKVELDETSY